MGLELWLSILGSGVITGVVGWIFGGRQQKAKDLKKADVEIDTAEIDYAVKVRDLYESMNKKLTDDKDTLKIEMLAVIDELKNDRAELKAINQKQDEEILKLRNDFRDMDKKFHDLYLAYSREMEVSSLWKDKFTELESKYIKLESDHEDLKQQFEAYKAKHK